MAFSWARRLIVSGVVLLVFSTLLPHGPIAPASGQDQRELPPPPPFPKSVQQQIGPDDVISVDTAEVLLPVTVRDQNGRLVTNLTKSDFQVFEDGKRQPLSDLALRQAPVDVVLMVDASSSVANNLDDFRAAVEGFAVKLSKDDRISLLKFDDRVEVLLDWSKSLFQLRRALNRITPGVFTRFNDALYLAAKDQLAKSTDRRAVICLTDGIDSGRGYADAKVALRQLLLNQVTLYVVSNTEIERKRKRNQLDSLLTMDSSAVRFNQLRIDDLREGLRVLDLSEQNLAIMTEATGGRLYKPNSFDLLDEIYAEVAEELRHQYALYYMPLNKARDGRFRNVKVETRDPGLSVTARIGYFAPR